MGKRLKINRRNPVLLSIVTILMLNGCASFEETIFNPDDHYKERLHIKARGELVVEAVALSNQESLTHFGYPLNDIGVQPVYVRITNNNNSPQLLFPIASDPDYFPPYEVAKRVSLIMRKDLKIAYNRLHDELIENTIAANSSNEGFIYTHADEGMKSFWIEMQGVGMKQNFHFVLPVPGLPSNYFSVDDDVLEAHKNTNELSKEELRTWLESLPCCTRNLKEVSGDQG